MADLQIVCCMCGDVGFPENLLHCTNCRHRFQHSYCSSYYKEAAEPTGLCDWCQSDQIKSSLSLSSSSRDYSKSSATATPSKKFVQVNKGRRTASELDHSNKKDEIKKLHNQGRIVDQRGENHASAITPSSRPTARRYKLLKDVMC